MFIGIALLFFCIPLCALIHFRFIGFLSNRFMIVEHKHVRMKTLFALFCLFCSHLSHIVIFSGAYDVLSRLKIGYLEGFVGTSRVWLENLYFSATCYTSLGFGEMYPVGMFRLISSFEALFGLVMLGWTASYLFMFMNKHIKELGKS